MQKSSLFEICSLETGQLLTFHDLPRVKRYTYNEKNNRAVQQFYLAAGIEGREGKKRGSIRTIDPISSFLDLIDRRKNRNFYKMYRRIATALNKVLHSRDRKVRAQSVSEVFMGTVKAISIGARSGVHIPGKE